VAQGTSSAPEGSRAKGLKDMKIAGVDAAS
jgi:hypothetical protein